MYAAGACDILMLQEALPLESVTAVQTSTALRPIRNEIVFPVTGESPAPGSRSVADIVARS